MIYIEPGTGFPLGDPKQPLLPAGFQLNHQKLQAALKPLILSASGWRKVFAADGDEESRTGELTEEDRIIALIMAEVWSSFLLKRSGKTSPVMYLGTDSRPTGPAIAEAMISVFLDRGIQVLYSFITAAPEIMAAAKVREDADGFAYISASHNPLGHNGVKFGLNDGGVIGGADAASLIADFKGLSSQPEKIMSLTERAARISSTGVEEIFRNVPAVKTETAELYYQFARRVTSGLTDSCLQDEFFSEITERSRLRGIGLVGELNGSARTLTIDRPLLEACGIKFLGVNDKPRQITHRIVPEGFSLDLCREELEKAHAKDDSFILGFVPDNDGDRGNLVYYNDKTQKSEILQAQEVFALSVLGELSWLSYLKERYPDKSAFRGPAGVAVNGPTSLRIEAVAGALGAEVFRAETGEANVVNRAREARQAGCILPILGEGSNGGNITHPAAVRDPLNTLFAILKLLLFPELYRNWCRLTGREEIYREDYSLADILESLPAFTTTSAFDERALMKIRSTDHGKLKRNYEEVFAAQWAERGVWLKESFGITGWREVNYEGTSAKTGVGTEFRSGAEKGGLKIELLNAESKAAAYLWMRGSGTEPVFRLMADLRGDNPEGEAALLSWHRSMIEEADGRA